MISRKRGNACWLGRVESLVRVRLSPSLANDGDISVTIVTDKAASRTSMATHLFRTVGSELRNKPQQLRDDVKLLTPDLLVEYT